MYYEHDSEDLLLIVFRVDVDGSERLKTIDTECDVVISPVADAEVIVYLEDGPRVVFDAAYGMLPSGAVVVAVKDADGAFPTGDEEINLRVIFEPYASGDVPRVETVTVSRMSMDCPVCGKAPGVDAPGSTEDPDEGPRNRCDFFFNSEN